jgi:hypothetical protein
MHGSVYSEDGEIAGWKLSGDSISKGTVILYSGNE